MNSNQIDHAMKHKLPVVYEGRTYTIAEYISSYDDNKQRRLSVSLLDGRTLIRVAADKVKMEVSDG